MKAVAFAEPGPPDVLEVIEREDPSPGAQDVLVRVRAAGVQPFDCAVRRGTNYPGFAVVLPQILGNEFAGVVERVGNEVWELTPGDEVLGWAPLACYAELLAVPAAQVVKKPADMPWEQAGALAGAGQAAHTALRELGVSSGDTVLIHAGAGGVGSFAVQIARAFGATSVLGTASERNHAFLRSLGAVPVSYGDGLAGRVRALAPGGIDAALDAAGADALTASLELVGDRRRIATLVEFDAAEKHGVRVLHTGAQRSQERLRELLDLWLQDRLRVHVSATFPLAAAADAHRLVESRHLRGKITLTMPPS
jgi:NADPH:quinone reductase-like Zn-dependent oxidoreductase